MHSVLQVVTPDQLSSVYSSLEPWALLKQIVGTKVRLVELRELKAKAKPKATDIMNNDATEEDPWKQSDPWSEAAAKLDNKKEDPVSISLISNFSRWRMARPRTSCRSWSMVAEVSVS